MTSSPRFTVTLRSAEVQDIWQSYKRHSMMVIIIKMIIIIMMMLVCVSMCVCTNPTERSCCMDTSYPRVKLRSEGVKLTRSSDSLKRSQWLGSVQVHCENILDFLIHH